MALGIPLIPVTSHNTSTEETQHHKLEEEAEKDAIIILERVEGWEGQGTEARFLPIKPFDHL